MLSVMSTVKVGKIGSVDNGFPGYLERSLVTPEHMTTKLRQEHSDDDRVQRTFDKVLVGDICLCIMGRVGKGASPL